MLKVIFKCSQNMNQYKEIMEFEDSTTDEEISKAFEDWVWQEVGDYFSWYREGE